MSTAGATRAALRRPSTPASSTFRLGVVSIVLVEIIWRLWTVSSWSWIQDDWIYQIEAGRQSLADYLTQNYNQHFMPGQFLVAWMTTQFAPLDYSVAMVFTVMTSTLSVLSWALAYREVFGERPRLLLGPSPCCDPDSSCGEVFGERPRLLLGLVLLALSPLFLPVGLWWAAALQVFPLQLVLAWVVFFTARYVRTRERRALLGMGLTYVVGLFFWQKALLLVIPVAFLVLFLEDGSVAQRLRRGLKPLAVLAVTTVVYLPAYLAVLAKPGAAGMGTDRTFSTRGVGESLSFFFSGVFNILLPSLFGGPWGAADNTTSLYDPVSPVLWLPMVALAVGVCVVIVRYRRRGGWIIAMVATYAVVSWGLVLASSRYETLGVLSIREARYSADLLPVAFLALMLTLTPSRVERDGGVDAVHRALPALLHGRLEPIIGTLTILVALSALMGNGAEWQRIEPHSPKAWVDGIVQDVVAVGNRSVINTPAPPSVIHPGFFPNYSHLRDMLAPLKLPVTYDTPASQVLLARADGRLTEATVEDLAGAAPGPVANCGYLVKPGEGAYVPIEHRLFAWNWFVQLDYFSERGGDVTLRTDTKTWDLHLQPGLNQLQVPVIDSVSALLVAGAPDAGTACITKIQVGNAHESARLANP